MLEPDSSTTHPFDVTASPEGSTVEESPTEDVDRPPLDRPRLDPVGDRRRIAPVHLALAVVGLLAGAALFVSGYSLGTHTAATPGTPAGQEQAFSPFWDAYDAITKQYVGPVDQKALVEGAVRGMFESLGDPFSAYLSAEDFQKTLQNVAGQFEGIGAEISTRKADGTPSDCTTLGTDCVMVITSPLPGSPAEKAGIRANDAVVAIDKKPVAGMTLDQAVALVRGKRGTTVTLTVKRGTTQLDVPIVRDTIVQKEVVTKTLASGTVGYIGVSGFSPTSATDFTAALSADVKAGEKKIIVDLRDNPGGYVDAARTMASQFIASGPLFWQEDAQGRKSPMNAIPGGVATDSSIKLVVLINKGSASASEIFAGAIQDTKRGQLVGETSYGKGTVQEWETLPNDAGGFRLSIAKWLTPDQRWIHHIGLTPDVAVTLPTTIPAGTDPVLEKALQVLGIASAEASAG